jgi:hypothetical protein
MSEHTTNLGGRLGDENIVKGGGLNVVGIQL